MEEGGQQFQVIATAHGLLHGGCGLAVWAGPEALVLAQIFFASDVRMAPGVATGSGKSASSVQATLAWPRHRTDGVKRDQSSGHAEHPGGPGFWPHRIAGHNWRAPLLHGNSVSFSTIVPPGRVTPTCRNGARLTHSSIPPA